MGFIDHKRVHTRQQFAEPLLFERQIGTQQMVIDDHQVGFLGGTAGLQHMALGKPLALLADAVFRGRGYARPDGGGLGHTGQLGDIAAASASRPVKNALQLIGLMACRQTPFAARCRQTMLTQIVGTPFQQRRAQRYAQCRLHRRQVTVKQLILQMPGAGRNDNLAPGQQRRHQVGKGLAGAGTGFDNQGGLVRQRRFHRGGHLLLLSTGRETRHLAG